MDRRPQSDPQNGADQRQTGGLKEVGGEDGPLECAQTTQDRHAHDLLTDIHVDCACHPDPSEEERRQTHQAQIPREVFHGRTHFLSANARGREFELVRVQKFPVTIPKLVSVFPLRHPEVCVITSDRPEGQQPGRGQPVQGDVNPRADRRLESELRGQPGDLAPQHESGLPDQQGVTHGRAQLDEYRRVGHDRGTLVDLRPGSIRR